MAEELKPAYLLAGTDRPKVDRAAQRLRARFSGDAVESHAAAETSGATRSRRATRSRCSRARAARRRRRRGGVEGRGREGVAAYLKAPAPATTLALVAAS
jgi:hypothetical protein